jgi:hypothetical protein
VISKIIVFAFASILTSRRMFDIVEFGYLLMGLTYENIEKTYANMFAQINQKYFFFYHR